MAAYEQSTSTLKTILSNPNLDLDHVERTTEALAEVMSNQEEIETAVRIDGEVAVGGSSGAGVDDDDLKKELEEMVKEEKEKEAEARTAEQARSERARVERAEKEKEAVPAATGGSTSTTPGAGQSAETTQSEVEAEKVWRERYEEAQQRKKEESERAEMERLRKQQRMAAE